MKTTGTVGKIKQLKTKEGKPFYGISLAEKNGEGQYEETTWWDVAFFPGKVKDHGADIEISSINVGDLISVSGVAHAETYTGESGTVHGSLKLKTTWIEVIARKGAGKKAGDAKEGTKKQKSSKSVEEDDVPF